MAENANIVSRNNNVEYILKTSTKSIPLSVNSNIIADYSKKIDALGTEIFVAEEHGNFDIKNMSEINQVNSFGSTRPLLINEI